MQLTVRLLQTDPAANLAAGTPSKTRRGFFPRRRAQQTPFRGSNRARGCTKSQCRRFPSPVCSLADPAPQSSANKEQCLRNYERKKSRGLAAPECSRREVKVARCGSHVAEARIKARLARPSAQPRDHKVCLTTAQNSSLSKFAGRPLILIAMTILFKGS